MREGGLIRDGYDADLDELRSISREGKGWIARLEMQERKATGINTLKVRYNRVFGYFIDIPKTQLAKVPEHYERKQTLANSERYFTPELKEHEDKVLGAQERLTSLEYEIFQRLRAYVTRQGGESRRLRMRLHRWMFCWALPISPMNAIIVVHTWIMEPGSISDRGAIQWWKP